MDRAGHASAAELTERIGRKEGKREPSVRSVIGRRELEERIKRHSQPVPIVRPAGNLPYPFFLLLLLSSLLYWPVLSTYRKWPACPNQLADRPSSRANTTHSD